MITRRNFLLASAAAGAGLIGFGPPAFAASYSDSAFEAAQAAGKSIILEFHADWCPTCRAQSPAVRSVMSSKYDDFAIFTVNYDSQKSAVKKFGVRRQSTLIVFKGKSEKGRAVGITSESAIAKLMAKAA
ncbi:thioredoxin family protein [Aestuariivirga sp.]|uniref:thioredoxin family protein n=1 Tax=Aestuariivirga sp. TaxID=2650926 RepID=UPI003593D768